MNKLNKNEKKFLELLSVEASTPNNRFKAKLQKKIMNEYSRKNILDNIFTHLNGGKVALLSLALISFAGLGLIVLGTTNLASQTKLAVNKQTFDENDKRMIIEKVIKNNSISILDNPINKISTDQVSSVDKTQDTTIPAIIKPETKTINYRFTQTVINDGIAFDQCDPITSFYKDIDSTKTYEYFSNNENYYKFEALNKNNQLVTSSLIKETPNKGISIQNKDDSNLSIVPGSYPASYTLLPTSYPEITSKKETELITQYLKQNPDVSKVVKENNNEYYILQGSFQASCGNVNNVPASYPASFPVSYAGNLSNIYFEYWVDTQSYNIVKLNVYVDSISDQNLLWSAQTFTSTKSVEFKEVENNFIQ